MKPGPGRPRGSRDKIPRALKASIRQVFEDIASEDPELIRAAVRAGLTAPPPKSFPYLQLAAAYVDGKPADEIKMRIERPPIRIINEAPDGSSDSRLITFDDDGVVATVEIERRGATGALVGRSVRGLADHVTAPADVPPTD